MWDRYSTRRRPVLRNPSNRLGAESGRRRQYVPVNHEALQIFATAHPSSRWTETLNTERFHKRDPTKQLGVRSSNLSEIVCTCNLQLGCRMKCLCLCQSTTKVSCRRQNRPSNNRFAPTRVQVLRSPWTRSGTRCLWEMQPIMSARENTWIDLRLVRITA